MEGATQTDGDEGQGAAANALIRPQLFIDAARFSGGQTLKFNDDDIIVLVGPNNAGKSASLRDLEALVSRNDKRKVVEEIELKRVGNAAGLSYWLDAHALRRGEPGQHYYSGLGFDVHHTHANYFESAGDRSPVAGFFCSRVGTEGRLFGGNAAPAVRLHFEPAGHPTHLLLADDILEREISQLFRRAFNEDLIPFRAGGSSFPLLVGQKPLLNANETEFSKEYINRLLSQSALLEEQGDGMRSFATVLLYVLASDHHSIQFLDEPEAFLHPPQAKLLGEFIATKRRSKAQLFIATHSPDVLEGLLSADKSRVRIVRIQRRGNESRIKELGKEKTATIASDPLLRYSGVLSGLFHQRVIIAEADSDCLFYNAMLSTHAVSGDQHPDVLFIHAGGKHRMRALVSPLRDLDVKVSVVADVDLMDDEKTFRGLVEVLGGDWAVLESDWKIVKNHLEHIRPPSSADQVKQRILDKLDGVSGVDPFPKDIEREIKKLFKSLSPWQTLKNAGRAALGTGAQVQSFDNLLKRCSGFGLWLVPEGELEGFCRSIVARHGPDFVEKVLTERDIEDDPELESARAFVKRIWNS